MPLGVELFDEITGLENRAEIESVTPLTSFVEMIRSRRNFGSTSVPCLLVGDGRRGDP